MRYFETHRNVLDVLFFACALGFGAAMTADEPLLSPLSGASDETRALVAKALDGYGGESNVGTVNLLHVSAQLEQFDSAGEYRMSIDSLSSFPDKHIARIRTGQGTMTLAIDGPDAYLVPARAAVRGAAIRLTSEERDDLIRYFVSDPFFVLRNRRSSRFLFAAGSAETVNGTACRMLHVYADGMNVAWLVDLATGRIVRTQSGDERSEFSDWKAAGGITVPELVTTTRGGKLVARTHYAAYEVNPRSYDVATQLRKPDLWLMRWKVQPKAGGTASSGGSASATESKSEAGTTAATYRPPDIQIGDSSVAIWDPSGPLPE